MGKAEDKRAAIVAKQAEREAAERAERLLHGPPPSPQKSKWGRNPRPRGPSARSGPNEPARQLARQSGCSRPVLVSTSW